MSMTTIVQVSERVIQLMRANVRPGHSFNLAGGERNSDGSWSLPLPPELLERIEQVRLPGETLADAIERILSIAFSETQ